MTQFVPNSSPDFDTDSSGMHVAFRDRGGSHHGLVTYQTGPGGVAAISAGAAPWTPARASRLWVVPPQPAAMAHVPGAFADVSWNAEQIAQNLFDPLVSSAPGYATRTIAGRDATDTYNVYRYDFTPEYGYDKTLILVGALHGSEIVGTLALARVLHYIVNDPHCHEDISYIRARVRLIVIPVANPWGVSQSTKTRQNGHGVDLNRNADYRWAQFTGPDSEIGGFNYKGSAPWSESESVILRDILLAEPEAHAFLDLHNLGAVDRDYCVYAPKFGSTDTEPLRETIDAMIADGEIEYWGVSQNPSLFTWAAATLGMTALNPEFPTGKYGGTYSAEYMTRAVSWFGNLIRAYAVSPRRTQERRNAGWVKELVFTAGGPGGVVSVNSTAAYVEIPQLGKKFEITRPGIVKFSGVVIVGGAVAQQFFITPKIGQAGDGSDWLPATQQVLDLEVYSNIVDAAARVAIPFCAAIPVIPSANENNFGHVEVGLYGKTGVASSVTIYRYRALVEFIPTDEAPFELWSAYGRADQGANAMAVKFPTPA